MALSRRQWIVSLFLTWHVTAVVAAVIPAAGSVQPPKAVQPEPADWIEAHFAPALDVLAGHAYSMLNVLRRAASPARSLTAPYMNVLGFDEHWVMFSEPIKFDQYVRVRYFVRTPSGSSRTATELVSPASPEYSVRTFQSFRGSYQDRAINTMLEQFHRSDPPRPRETNTPSTVDRPYLPLATYLSRKYASHLAPDERLERLEIWHGAAPNPPPRGQQTPSHREDLLRDYYSGLVDSIGPAVPAPLSATEREEDIGWTLEFVQTF
jgi:hypothetical protein